MTVFSSSTCPKCKVLKMKLDKAGIEYTVNENVEEAAALGIKSLPYIQLSNGKLLDFAASIAFVRDMEAANQ
jgi:glutaredoxin